MFDDTSSQECEWNWDNGRGYGTSVKMPLSDHNNWSYFYDRKIKPFFAAIPQRHWATHNRQTLEAGGRPIIITYTAAWFDDVATDGQGESSGVVSDRAIDKAVAVYQQTIGAIDSDGAGLGNG